ncbi:MAG: DUF983 domain-containing protein [Bacteroidota bacterium]
MLNALRNVLTMRCPKCRQGHLFTHRNPYRLKGYFSMPDRCPVCQQSYLLEPGFYYGSMYVNYGVTIALSVATFVAMYVLGSPWETHEYLIGIALTLLLTAPFTFRLARAIWISFFVRFDPAAGNLSDRDHGTG